MATSIPAKGAANSTRNRLSFRNTRTGDVLPSSIDSFSRLTVDPATKAALTAAGAKLTVEIDAAGTRVFLADQRNGTLIGGPEDLSKIGGIRAFVTRERKDASGVEIAREIAQIAYRASNAMMHENPAYVQGALESSYGAAVRPLLLVIEKLAQNQRKLEENTNPTLRATFEPMLKSFFIGIKNCYFRLILAHTVGQNKKGLLADLLFDEGIPEYVHSKLTNQSLVLDRSQELARVLFPADPSKGLSLTLKEWRTQPFKQKLGLQILGLSALVSRVANHDGLIRTICKIDGTIDLGDETNPSVGKLLKCRLHVVPPMRDTRYVIEPGSKTRAGWKFPSPSMDTIQGAIASLSIAIMRVYSANLQSVDLIGDYYANIVPGAVSRAAVTPTNNLYVQWGNAPNHDKEYFAHLDAEENGIARQNVWRWIRTEMRLSEKAEGGKALAAALCLKETGEPLGLRKRQVSVEEPDPSDSTKTVTVVKDEEFYPSLPRCTAQIRVRKRVEPTLPFNLLAKITPAEVPLVSEFQKRTFPRKVGKKKVAPSGGNLSRLTQEGVELTEEVEKISSSLADRMRSWLRGFSDARVQRAAAKLAMASFDELFLNESNDSEKDEASDDDSDEEDG